MSFSLPDEILFALYDTDLKDNVDQVEYFPSSSFFLFFLFLLGKIKQKHSHSLKKKILFFFCFFFDVGLRLGARSWGNLSVRVSVCLHQKWFNYFNVKILTLKILNNILTILFLTFGLFDVGLRLEGQHGEK